MSDPNSLSRRDFLIGGSALVGSSLLPLEQASAAETIYDFRGRIPAGWSYWRGSIASFVNDSTSVRFARADAARFPIRGGRVLGLLIEGSGVNRIKYPSALKQPGWSTVGTVTAAFLAAEKAPDGSLGVYQLTRGAPTTGSFSDYWIPNPATGVNFGTASVWLRSPSGTGTWRIRLRDFSSYNGVTAVVEVGPEWRRYALTVVWNPSDTGAKRFAVAVNEPVSTGVQPVYALNFANPYLPPNTPVTLTKVLVWGAQYDVANVARSLINNTTFLERYNDNVTTSASKFNTERGRLTFVLPDGGRRGSVLFDASTSSSGLRIEYTNSGWLMARVGPLLFAGYQDVTKDTVVRLEWSPSGAQLFSGASVTTLQQRAGARGVPTPLGLPTNARLGMSLAGSRPLGQIVATVGFEPTSSDTVQIALTAAIIPSLYKLTFSDDFNDSNVGRINENATGGTTGAPAWRSRYRQERWTVINSEKQIYMDVKYAGTSTRPLGVQPFSIANGILTIKCDRADPTLVTPYIFGYKYTSGCITTEYTHWQTYGYFEMRAKLPAGKGFWPAFWLLPKATIWPPEIDVLEGSGIRPFGVHQGVIEKPRTSTTLAGTWIDQIIDTTDGFHTYAVEWTQDNIVFFIDGIKSFEYGPHNIKQDMYLLVNLALGSSDPGWIPDPDSTTPFPGLMQVDFVNAYNR